MGTYQPVEQAPDYSSRNAHARRGGTYQRFHPDLLPTDRPIRYSFDLSELVTETAQVVQHFSDRAQTARGAALLPLLLRSEGIASSAIEGLEAPVQEISIAQLDPNGPLAAHEIARAISSTQAAVSALAENRPWQVSDLHILHRALLPQLHDATDGFRTAQAWVGGSSPLDADYVPPPAEKCPHLIDNLLTYANTTTNHPIVMTAALHAQFETIHPYPDGNGRVGRVLIHAGLTRAGLVHTALPVSRHLRARTDDYVAALTDFRCVSETFDDGALAPFLRLHCESLLAAVNVAHKLLADIDDVYARWEAMLGAVRSDAVAHQVIQRLTEQPVCHVQWVIDTFDVTRATAHSCIERLVDVGVLTPVGEKYKRRELFAANDILGLTTRAERQAASRVLDTSLEKPDTAPIPMQCPEILPRKGVQCCRYAGHPGPHR